MVRLRGIWLWALLVLVASATGLFWWGGTGQTLFADNAGPGVKLQLQSVHIPSDRKPVVLFKITDDNGNALSPGDLDAGSIRFMIDRIDTDPATGLTSYFDYVMTVAVGKPYSFGGVSKPAAIPQMAQPFASGDSLGAFSYVGSGVWKYTFVTVLPQDFNRSATHAVGIQASRGNRAYASNDVIYFVPNGGTPSVSRQVVDTTACNRCHDPLKVHGNSRRDTKLCVLCHTPQNFDVESGNSLDFKVYIHKIHDGDNLPSVKAGQPYFIASDAHDFSDVGFPQDVRNCTTCHTNAPQADNWKTAPSNAACTSCHDDVNALTGQNHAGGVQTDATCKTCHTSTMTSEFDLSIPGSHLIPVKSSQLRGVNFDVVSVTNTKPGQNPTVVFSIKDKDGKAIAPSEMNNLSLVIAGPTTDYQTEPVVSASAIGATPVGDGTFSYTYSVPVPDDASGTFAVGIQGYISTTIKGPGGNPLAGVRDAGMNKIAYAAVTDAKPMPRKQIVDLASCNKCHQELGSPVGLSIHGGSRRDTQFCVLCHNANHTGASGSSVVTVQFDVMIHRIHKGDKGSSPYAIGNTDFAEVRFPGDLRDCQKCHTPGSNLIDFLHYGAQPNIVRQPITAATTTTRRVVNTTATVIRTTPPIAAACTACHDSQPAKEHAAAQVAPDGQETCITCHGEGGTVAVSRVHAIP